MKHERKTNRTYGEMYRQIRKFLRTRRRFTIDSMIRAIPITRKQADSNLSHLVRVKEVKVIKKGDHNGWAHALGKGRKTVFAKV